MSTAQDFTFATFQALITSNGVTSHGAEIHGMLSGLICSGIAFENSDYMPMVNDCFNNGEGLPIELKNYVKALYSNIWQQVLDDGFGFQVLLPDDDESIAERTAGLGAWVQGFNLGFGLQNKDSAITNAEVKEVLADFAEIANLSDDVDEDEESEQAYFELAEYVRISALLIFSELGQAPLDNSKPETIH